MAIIIAIFGPSIIISSYQKVFATGIFAVSYGSDTSSCQFNMTNAKTLHGECKLPFKNYSSSDVKFSIEFYDKYSDEDEIQMVSLMNNNSPYEVELTGNQKKTVKIESNIDVSKMEKHIESGNAVSVNIILKSGKKMRKL